MQKIKDSVFGEMEYRHSWTKKDSLMFLGKAYIVDITAQAYSGDEIIDSQRDSYKNYTIILEAKNDSIQDKLKEYFKDMFDNESPLADLVVPKTVIFERDGSWGVLFETDCDIENGVAVFFDKDAIKVGSQDEFI